MNISSRQIKDLILYASALILIAFIAYKYAHVPELEYKIRIADIISYFITIGLALFINYSVNTFTSNKRYLKTFLVGEIESCIDLVDELQLKIEGFHNTILQDTDKKSINRSFIKLGNKINTLGEQIIFSFAKENNKIYKEDKGNNISLSKKLDDIFLSYKTDLTEDYMTSTFTVDDKYLLLVSTASELISKELKMSIHKINLF